MTWLVGRKTYLVSLAMLAYAVGGYFLGNVPQEKAVELVMEGLGLGALRAGVAKRL